MALTISPAGRTVTPSQSTQTQTTQSQSASLPLVRSTVGDILGMQAKQTEYAAAAQGQRTQAAGYDAEVAAYGSSEKVAEQNAVYAGVSSNITALQAKREALSAAGGQRASLAGAGFHEDADIIHSTLRQGYLQDQIARTQGNFEQSGYLEQAAASRAQVAAAGIAKGSALDLANIYDSAGAQASTYAANATTGLSSYLSNFNLKNTSAAGLLSGTDVGTELATAPQVTTSSSTGTSSQGAPTFVAAPGTHAGYGYYVGLEDSSQGVVDDHSGTLARPDQLHGVNPTLPAAPQIGQIIAPPTTTTSQIGQIIGPRGSIT